MNYLNLEIRTLRSEEYLGSEPVDRATWMSLLTYCAMHENGGKIVDAREWGERKWPQLCGVTKEEVQRTCKLWRWQGNTLLAWGYPVEQEREIRAKRRAGKERAKKRWGANGSADSSASSLSDAEADSSADAERKEKESKGMEGKGITPKPPGTELALGGEARQGKTQPSTEEGKAISRLFNRKETTGWAPKEVTRFKDLMRRGILSPENLELVTAYYAAERAKGESGIHRRDLLTFLNNFDGELDRARAWQQVQGAPNHDGFTEV